MKYKATINPWKCGEGWKSHCIADREANSIGDLLGEINKLEFYREDLKDTDYLIVVSRGGKDIVQFWLAYFLEHGVVIEDVLYEARGKI